jgi:hypothetical protein
LPEPELPKTMMRIAAPFLSACRRQGFQSTQFRQGTIEPVR